MAFNPDDLSRFDNFSVFTTPYKIIDSHEITLDVLVPKSQLEKPAASHPVLIRFHGGGLVAGASMFPDFFGRWLLEFAERHSAIIVSANNRLLPESNGNDIMEDIEDFWKWLHTSLAAYLEKETSGRIKPDLNRIMTAGESAGGYLSLQLALNHPNEIRAATAQYPMADMKSPHFMEDYHKQLMVFPQFPEDTVRKHVADVKSKEELSGKKVIVSDDRRLARAVLFATIVQHGLFREFFGADKKLYPIERVESGEKLPKGGVFIWHGKEDSMVPIEGSEKFIAAVKKSQPELYCKLAAQPGEHGFDANTKIDEAWIKDGMAPLLKAWLD